MPSKSIKIRKVFLVTDLNKEAENFYPYLSRLGFPSEKNAVSNLVSKFEISEKLAKDIYKQWIRDCDKYRADNLAEPHPIHKKRMETLNILRKAL